MADEVKIQISADTKGVEKEFDKVSKAADSMSKDIVNSMGDTTKQISSQFEEINSTINKIGIGAGAVFAGVTYAMKGFLDSFLAADETTKQLELTLKNMGASAGITIEQINALGSEIQSYSKFTDTAVKESVKLLLTFQNISTDSIPRVTKAVADLAAKMGTDLGSASFRLGRALEDPLKGITSLWKAGVRFTDEQERMIKTMVQAGDTAGAQNIILSELEKRFKGAAEASANPFIQLKNAIGSVSEEIGKVLSGQLSGTVSLLKDLALVVKDNKELMGFFAQALIAVAKVAGVFLTVAAGAKAFQALNNGLTEVLKYIPRTVLVMDELTGTMVASTVATKGMSAAVKTLIGSTGLGLLIAFLPEITDLLKDFWHWVEGPQVNTKNFKEVTDRFTDVGKQLEDAQNKLNEARKSGYSEIDTKPLSDRIAKLQTEYNTLNDIKKGLTEDIKAGKTVEGAEGSPAAKDKTKNEEQKKLDEKLAVLEQEKKALLLQRDFKVRTEKDTKEQIAILDKQYAEVKLLADSKERTDLLTSLDAQRNELKKFAEDKTKLEIKYIEDKGKLAAEREKALALENDREMKATLDNVALKETNLQIAHDKELEMINEQEQKKLDLSVYWAQQKAIALAEQKAIEDEIAVEQAALEEELGRQLNQQELDELRAQVTAKQGIEKKKNDDYTKDLIAHGKLFADTKKTFQSKELADTASFLDSINTLTKGKNKELGLIAKAFAIKDIIISTWQSVSASSKIGYPQAIPAVAASIAQGAVSLATVLGVGFAKGGMVTGGLPNVDSVPIMAQSGELVAPKRNFDEVVNAVADRRNAQSNGDTSNSMSVVIQGNVIADSDEQVDRLIERINTAIEFRNTKLYGVT